MTASFKRTGNTTVWFWLLVAFGMALVLTGCGGSGASAISGLPTPSATRAVNSYVGKLGASLGQGDPRLWNVMIDHNQNSYAYSAGTGSTASTPVTGSLAVENGFLLLLDASGYQMGYGLEIPGQVAILRPGNSSTAPIFAVQQPNCFSIGGNVKLQFALVPGDVASGYATFGKVYATTNSDGSAWSFDGLTQYQLMTSLDVTPANASIPSYPTAFSGNCSASNGAASVNIPPSPTYSVPTRFIISPGGFMLEDQNYTNMSQGSQSLLGDIASLGIVGPTSPLTTSSVTHQNYLGFLFEASNGTYLTQPVGFGIVASSTAVNGGTFPNEDPTQTPNSNMSIAFGSQDPLNNGLYYLATFTLPVNSIEAASCSAPGTDSSGDATCTYDAVASVGTPEGKYAIILTAYDSSGYQKVLVLYQQ